MSEPAALQVFCTIDSEPRARDLGAALVEERLAACVQVLGPVHSTYRWQGAVETATEWLLLMKTTPERLPALRDAVERRHPYDVPELVAVPISDGLADYLSWIASSVSERADARRYRRARRRRRVAPPPRTAGDTW